MGDNTVFCFGMDGIIGIRLRVGRINIRSDRVGLGLETRPLSII